MQKVKGVESLNLKICHFIKIFCEIVVEKQLDLRAKGLYIRLIQRRT
jgi:hypothetical protein